MKGAPQGIQGKPAHVIGIILVSRGVNLVRSNARQESGNGLDIFVGDAPLGGFVRVPVKGELEEMQPLRENPANLRRDPGVDLLDEAVLTMWIVGVFRGDPRPTRVPNRRKRSTISIGGRFTPCVRYTR